MTIPSYGKIHQVGHSNNRDLFQHELVVEEKVDGSQISFGLVDSELVICSKNCVIDQQDAGMFEAAVESIKKRRLCFQEGWIYRGEFLKSTKHNVLNYERIPTDHIVILDIEDDLGAHLNPAAKKEEARRIGLECVPLLHVGTISDMVEMRGLLERTSFLGVAKIEGVVFKAYGHVNRDGKLLMGKFVNESFKEVHKQPKTGKPHRDILEVMAGMYCTKTRWEKAVQHLKEEGRLDESPRDIGELMKAVNVDVLEECKEEIKEELFKWAWPQISKSLAVGLPQWYKNRLAEAAFTEGET